MKTFPNHFFSSRMIATALPFLSALPLELASGQGDYPMTYKSGINVNILGTAGSDYAVEDFYHDRTLADFKVVFLKDTTLIEMEHNANNIAGVPGGNRDYQAAGLDVGRIVIKPDGDRHANLPPKDWHAYSAPFGFGSLNYGIFGDPDVQVVGATGGNGVPQTLSNKATHYFRGILDSVGDEWHTLTVADDDSADSTINNEFRASDGKVHLFVVNPKTPCLTWTASGTGQYYTTPAKTYFVSHIYDQTTYFSGTVSVTIRDINSNNVFYRINGGSFIDAENSHVTLDQNAFISGENTLEYYYAGNAAFTRTRTVVKNPSYPSAGETHGDRLWLGSANFDTHIKEQLKADWWMNQWRTKETHHNHSNILNNMRTGKRNVASGRNSHGGAIVNALVARCYGTTQKTSSLAPHTFAEYAKFALFESHTCLDPVGFELAESGTPKATRELMYRGYYDVQPIFGYAGTYDYVAGYFRANQGHTHGMTAVEDYFIRDSLARWVHMAGLYMGGYDGTSVNPSSLPDDRLFTEPGMWGTARHTGAAMIASMMPNYSTPYYGTSGMGGQEVPASPASQFIPHINHTWFDLLLDDNVPLSPYPNGVAQKMGVDIQFTAEGKWHDRISYSATALQGLPLGVYHNILKMHHPTKTIPNFDLAMGRAAQGLLQGNKFTQASDHNSAFRSWAMMLNSLHPAFRAVAQPAALARDSGNAEHPGQQQNTGGPFTILWYDRNISPGGDLLEGAAATVPSDPSGLRVLGF